MMQDLRQSACFCAHAEIVSLQDQAEYLAADTQKQSDVLAIQEQWGWAGLGADSPKQVPGLSCVRSIALGAQHAIAIVE